MAKNKLCTYIPNFWEIDKLTQDRVVSIIYKEDDVGYACCNVCNDHIRHNYMRW
jgi:hypothetical protein